ncbi:PREDICTED: transmembrane protease serine 9-like [Dufourea novaeangliae]|uniref:transmembrane protease serine 9-like n=1 Tax=Dufourea novaeangliae TaxID=178035 RepID=UPI000767978E|nr:PREDICTED: transmembrane protease serine 9-like [Dufourea novaeangliae]
MLTKCVLAAILVLQVCSAIPYDLTPRITDGVDAAPGEFPYQVSIQWGIPPLKDYAHACGGSILNENYILTAGHCVLKIGKLRVVAGRYYLNKAEESDQIIKVVKTIVHSGYNGGVAQHDIALLKLETPLKMNKLVAPISLPGLNQKQTGQAVLSGWGSISKKIIPVLPTVLQKAYVPILENDDCYNQLTAQPAVGKQPELFETQVCSGTAGQEVSACSGDSGGPLAQIVGETAVQVGIVSWGMMPCGSSHMPSVYTRVASYIDWINQNISVNFSNFLYFTIETGDKPDSSITNETNCPRKSQQTIEMSLKLVIFACLLAVAVATKPYRGFNLPLFDGRIVGGSEATPGQYPWQVSLQWGMFGTYSHFCGGSIVAGQWILTAGHCVDAVPSYGDFLVKAGKHSLKLKESSEQVVKVVKSFVHEKYPGNVAPYDIALLKLEKPLTLTKTVQPISLPEEGSIPTGTAVLTGWGSTSRTNNPIMPDKLQTAPLPLVDLATCKKAIEDLTGPSPLHETNICSGPLTGGYSACSGDSGGPLVLNQNGKTTLIGIVSWGIVPCGTLGAPSVYTRTSAFNSWINGILSKN